MTGMCGGVRGVGAGGVISTAYCLLYKMFTLKITRKQLVSMINSRQSVYLRGLGFMYIRYTQPPSDLWAWMEPYLVNSLNLFYYFRMMKKKLTLVLGEGTKCQ